MAIGQSINPLRAKDAAFSALGTVFHDLVDLNRYRRQAVHCEAARRSCFGTQGRAAVSSSSGSARFCVGGCAH